VSIVAWDDVSITQAKIDLEKLITRTLRGEEIIICRGDSGGQACADCHP
jgi:antitoxin (DNA-binding transcriptional repressor) of toxin-antitoxin stability system